MKWHIYMNNELPVYMFLKHTFWESITKPGYPTLDQNLDLKNLKNSNYDFKPSKSVGLQTVA